MRWMLAVVLAVAVAASVGCGDGATSREPAPQPAQQAADPAPQAGDPCAPDSLLRQEVERRAREEMRRLLARHPHAHVAGPNSGCGTLPIPTHNVP